jgi:hypothetical protein
MEVFQLTLMLLVFLAIAATMFLRRLPAILALPLMAFLIPLIAGVPLDRILQFVIGAGSVKLHQAYTVALFGSMLSVLLQKTGVAENFIKIGAELAGDNPWGISVMMMALITLLFTTLGGLGAIIMVATIVMPILSAVGVGAMTVVGIFLIGLSMGGILNAGNWAVYVDVMGLTVDEVRPFALIMFAMTFIGALIYISVQLFRDGHDFDLRRIARNTIIVVVLSAAVILGYLFLPVELQQQIDSFITTGTTVLYYTITAGLILLTMVALFHALPFRKRNQLSWTAYFTPLIPLILILIYSFNFIAAFICGLLYGFIATYRRGSLNLFVSSLLEGGSVVMPAVALMLGIGMLLNAIIGPGGDWPVITLLRPLVDAAVPRSPAMYVIGFGIAAPLALYRGPLNVWGMGYGLAAVFLAAGLPPGVVMGLLMAVGQVQGVSDPTNTHNIWLANEMGQDVQKILWNTLPYTWALAFAGLTAAAFIFFR